MNLSSRPQPLCRTHRALRARPFAVLAATAILSLIAHPALAAITWTGDVDPSDPTTWTDATTGYIGKTAEGTLTIDGASDLNSQVAFIAHDPGSTGTVTVDGIGSTWAPGGITVGVSGNGTLAITNGGTVSDYGGYIGFDRGSTGAVTVDGVGSTWTKSGGLNVGFQGSGTLAITGGATVSNSLTAYIGGPYFDSSGAVAVDGTGSTWTNDSFLFVGNLGSGTLAITGGGTVDVAEDVWVSGNPMSASGIHFDNGTLSAGGLLSAAADLTGTGTVHAHGVVTDVDLTFDATRGLTQSVTLNELPGQSITLNLDIDGSGPMGAGWGGAGTMSISEGVVVPSTQGLIGYRSGSSGAVTVSGAGSKWTSTTDLTVGILGSGTLAISGGGMVQVANDTWVAREFTSSSRIDFDNGTLSTGGLLAAAADLTGTGTIHAHGLVTDIDLAFDATRGLTQTVMLDQLPGQDITLHLDVDGSRAMGVGHRGAGSMSIADGVVVESTAGYVGFKAGSTGAVTVDGAGSTWANDGDLFVGDSGSGRLAITDGGAVSSRVCIIGSSVGSTGVVTVDGAGSVWTDDARIYVGNRGSGVLDIAAGGAVSSRQATIGTYSSSKGGVTVDGAGSTWTISDAFTIGRGGMGSLVVTGGGTVSTLYGDFAQRSIVGDEEGSVGAVTVSGAGSTWTINRSLYVGRYGNGTLAIAHGGLVSVGDKLTIDFDGDGDSFINMATGGMLAMNGYAESSLSHFLALVSGTDAIRYWDADAGAMALLTAATYGDDYTLEYLTAGDLAGYTLLTVTAAGPPGDYNGDFVVDGGDLLAWQRGDSPGPHSAADLAQWQANYGWSAQLTANSAAVPEPTVWALAVVACLALRLRLSLRTRRLQG